ncbi:MAG: SagB/ThcOx family dehydrogenase [Deltaproteobacteria bacterium]|nr:SagB/ThcOx family dehydrogenase [Deltaproteobacteria bacterium]
MGNHDIAQTWSYHDRTKHSYQSVRTNAHYLDWENHPLAFKIYKTLEPLALPRDVVPLTMPILDAIAALDGSRSGERVPDLRALTLLFSLSNGVTRVRTHPGGEIAFRAAACTGALYHIELYLVCGDLPGLEAGVYHFGAHDLGLRRLRAGDYRGTLLRASGGEPAIAQAPAVLVCTSTYWRNAWKYQARTYRHCFWDTGTILANLLATAAGLGLPVRVVAGFVDAIVNGLLGLDAEREVAVSLVPIGRVSGPPPPPPPDRGPLALETMPISKTEVDYPAIRAMHAASSLVSEEEAAAWRGQTPTRSMPAGRLIPLTPLGDAERPEDSIPEVILRRGSSRRFAREPITFAQLSTMLSRATRGVPADFLAPPGVMLNDLYVIAHAVEGLPAGAYVLHREAQALERLKEGEFRREAGYLGLEQALPADASVNVYFMADLNPILARYGNRGYRATELEAGIIGGRLYLAAYALRLGASGLTFYDDEVTAFFSPHAAGKSTMFLVAAGRPARRARAADGQPLLGLDG